MKKKILLGLGATTAVIAPLATVVACGSGTSDSGAKVGKIGKAQTKDGTALINAFGKTDHASTTDKTNSGKVQKSELKEQARIDSLKTRIGTIKTSKLTAYDVSYLVFTNKATGLIKMTPFLSGGGSASEVSGVNNQVELNATAKDSTKVDKTFSFDLSKLSASNNLIENAAKGIKAFQDQDSTKEYGYTVTNVGEVFTINIYKLKDTSHINDLITKLNDTSYFKFNEAFIKQLGGTYIEGMPHDFNVNDKGESGILFWATPGGLLYVDGNTKSPNNKGGGYHWEDRVHEGTFQSWTQFTFQDKNKVSEFKKFNDLKLIKTQFVYDQKEKKQYLRLIVQNGNIVKATYIDATPTQTFAEGDSKIKKYSTSEGAKMESLNKGWDYSSSEVISNILPKIKVERVKKFMSDMASKINQATASIKTNIINLSEAIAHTTLLLKDEKTDNEFIGKVLEYAKANETTTKVHFKTWVTSLVNLSYKELADPMNIGARGYSGIYALIDFYRIAAQYLDSL